MYKEKKTQSGTLNGVKVADWWWWRLAVVVCRTVFQNLTLICRNRVAPHHVRYGCDINATRSVNVAKLLRHVAQIEAPNQVISIKISNLLSVYKYNLNE